jgi:hypothetical protein
MNIRSAVLGVIAVALISSTAMAAPVDKSQTTLPVKSAHVRNAEKAHKEQMNAMPKAEAVAAAAEKSEKKAEKRIARRHPEMKTGGVISR